MSEYPNQGSVQQDSPAQDQVSIGSLCKTYVVMAVDVGPFVLIQIRMWQPCTTSKLAVLIMMPNSQSSIYVIFRLPKLA